MNTSQITKNIHKILIIDLLKLGLWFKCPKKGFFTPIKFIKMTQKFVSTFYYVEKNVFNT